MLRAATAAALVAAFALAPAAGVAWQGNMLAVRTSRGILRPGDTLRVELLALDTVFGPFRARVRYRFAERVTVRDEEGGERQELRERVLVRSPGAAIESLAPGQTVLLDDTFHLGSSSEPGAYQVEVDILDLGLDRPADTIRALRLPPRRRATRDELCLPAHGSQSHQRRRLADAGGAVPGARLGSGRPREGRTRRRSPILTGSLLRPAARSWS